MLGCNEDVSLAFNDNKHRLAGFFSDHDITAWLEGTALHLGGKLLVFLVGKRLENGNTLEQWYPLGDAIELTLWLFALEKVAFWVRESEPGLVEMRQD